MVGPILGLVLMAPAATVLDRAIAAAGGAARLERYEALEWRGQAVIYTGGSGGTEESPQLNSERGLIPRERYDHRILIEGRWRVRPPDHAAVETHEVGRGPGSLRRMILAGDRGWSQREGRVEPLPADLIPHERDQFYLYYVMRLVPLRASGFRLTALEPDSTRAHGLRVSSPGRRDVDLYFGDDGRLARLVTRVVDPHEGREVVEELRFSGTIEGQGVRWPRKMAITWDGRPYFDLELTEFTPVRTLDPQLFSAPR